MRPRCRVCGSRRCLTPVERERARRVREVLRVAALRLLCRRAAPVLEAAERWERARSATEGRGLLPLDVIEEWHQACVALAAAVRARRDGA